MNTRAALIALACAGTVLVGCTSASNEGVPLTGSSLDGSGEATSPPTTSDVATAAAADGSLACIGTEWTPVMPDKWVFHAFPTDTAVLVPCSEPHTGLRVATWASDAAKSIATRPGTGTQQELQAMAPDAVRCSEAVASLLGSDRPTRFQSILSYTADRATAVCDVALANNEATYVPADEYILSAEYVGISTWEPIAPAPTPFANLPSPLAGALSGDLWKAYPTCVRQQQYAAGRPFVSEPCPPLGARDRANRYVTQSGFLNPDGATEYPGEEKVRRLVADHCGTGPHRVPDSIAWNSGGNYACWSKSLPRSTPAEKSAVLTPDPGTLIPGTCLDYTAWYAQTTARAADRAVPCDQAHSAVVIGSPPSIDGTQLPAAGWLGVEAVLSHQGILGSADWERCSDQMWDLAGPNAQIPKGNGAFLSQRTTLAPRVSYLQDASGTVRARCDMVNLAGYLPAVVGGINLGDDWTQVAKCIVKAEVENYYDRARGKAILVPCATPGALARTKYGELRGPAQWPGRRAALRLARQACAPDRVVTAAGSDAYVAAPLLVEGWNGPFRYYYCGVPLQPNKPATSVPTTQPPIPSVTAPPTAPLEQMSSRQIKSALLDSTQFAAALGIGGPQVIGQSPQSCRSLNDWTSCSQTLGVTDDEVITGAWIDVSSHLDSAALGRQLSEFSDMQMGKGVGWSLESLTPTTLLLTHRATTDNPIDTGHILTIVGSTVVQVQCFTTPQPDTAPAAACAQRLAQAQANKLADR